MLLQRTGEVLCSLPGGGFDSFPSILADSKPKGPVWSNVSLRQNFSSKQADYVYTREKDFFDYLFNREHLLSTQKGLVSRKKSQLEGQEYKWEKERCRHCCNLISNSGD
ncbi:hypothetical protein AVEN_3629-1 [Araneus ventricosus]|uniref:Uncharacterized protein n=1 Tax=Araneus ventricosus TaxID=182803 RepID=A0A4Y2KH57_ARAVE|nr:hypothetical protein AVEN_3629-1 [Araneus ventricosus]